jgi:hypothetical protein
MATGLAPGIAAELLDALVNNDTYTAGASLYVQLHTADPGSAGTSSVATETTRKQASFAAASNGTVTTDADLEWTGVSGSEDYSHFSVWTASTAGTFLFSGTITANAVTAGDTFTIPAGELDASFNVAS